MQFIGQGPKCKIQNAECIIVVFPAEMISNSRQSRHHNSALCIPHSAFGSESCPINCNLKRGRKTTHAAKSCSVRCYLVDRRKLEIQDLAGFLIFLDCHAGNLDEGAVFILLGAALGVGPEGVHRVTAVICLTGGKGGFVQDVDCHGVVRLVTEQGAEGGVHDADHGLVVPFRSTLQNQVCHSVLDLHALCAGIVGGAGGGAVAVAQITQGGACAQHGQQHHDGDLLPGEAHIRVGAVCNSGPAGDGQQEAQEQGQHHGFNGEHGQVLQNPAQGHDAQDGLLGLLGVADVGIPPGVDELLQHHIDKEADAEAAEHDPHGGDLRPVEEQSVEHGAGDFCQHEGQKILAGGVDHEAHGVGDDGGGNCHHGAEDHGTQGGGQHGGLDAQLGTQGDRQGLQRNPKGDHQGGEHQHAGTLHFVCGVTPVGAGEGMGIERGRDFGSCHKNNLLVMQQTAGRQCV